MRTIVIYHGGGCSDGFAAAWLFSKAYPDAEFVAVNYGDPVPRSFRESGPDVYGARVFVLDFSWKRPEMVALIEEATQVIVLDHHATAEKELAGLALDEKWGSNPTPPEIIFDMTKSGATLAHEWLVKNIPNYPMPKVPNLVRYVEDRDLWALKLNDSKAINAALRTYPKAFADWDKLYADMETGVGRDRLVAEGAGILRADAAVVAQHVRTASEMNIAGHKTLVVNATVLISEIAGELAAGRAFGATFFDKLRDDGAWERIWSLRVRDGDFDVGQFATEFGGGGHKKAAGYKERL